MQAVLLVELAVRELSGTEGGFVVTQGCSVCPGDCRWSDRPLQGDRCLGLSAVQHFCVVLVRVEIAVARNAAVRARPPTSKVPEGRGSLQSVHAMAAGEKHLVDVVLPKDETIVATMDK